MGGKQNGRYASSFWNTAKCIMENCISNKQKIIKFGFVVPKIVASEGLIL